MLNALEVSVVEVGFLEGLEGVFHILSHEVCNLSFTVSHGVEPSFS